MITRLSVDGYGAKRAGNFSGKVTTETVLLVENQINSGGYDYHPLHRKLTKRELERRFGLDEEEAKVVDKIAEVTAKSTNLEEDKRKLLLLNEFRQRKLAENLQAIGAMELQRSNIISMEISKLLKQKIIEDENDKILDILMLAAAA